MSGVAVDRPGGTTSARVALIVLLVAVGVVGLAAGAPFAVTLATVAALLCGLSLGILRRGSTRRAAVASAVFTLGAVGLPLAVVLAYFEGAPLVGALATVGLLYGAVEAFTGFDRTVADRGTHLFWTALRPFLLGVLVAAGWHLLVTTGSGVWFVETVASVATRDVVVSFVVLQTWLVVLALLVRSIAEATARWHPGEDPIGPMRDPVAAVPRAIQFGYVGALVVQWFVALEGTAAEALQGLLASTPTLEVALGATLLSVWPHLLAAALAVTLAIVWVLLWLHRQVVGWAGPAPGQTVADAAGAVLAVLAIPIFVHLGATITGTTVDWWLVAFVGPSALAMVATMVVVGLVVESIWMLSRTDLGPIRADLGRGFVLGGAALFGGVVLVADQVPALFVFLGVAAVVLVWDLGRHAVSVGPTSGGSGDETVVELVHATTTGAVLTVGVAVAVGAGLAITVVSPSLPGWRARLSLALALAGLLVVAYAIQR